MHGTSARLRIEPDWIKYDRCVLRYLCYTKEAIKGSSLENYRVRKFILQYFLEDKTVEVSEITDENSGLVGGTFFKRQQLTRPSDHACVSPQEDLRCGSNVEIYARIFRLVSLDEYTREFYRISNLDQGIEESVPIDSFTNRTVKSGGSSRSKQGHHHKLPLDLIREKALVNVLCGGTDLNRKVRQFIEQGGKILRFYCLWNDESEDGFVHYFDLHYFLADDTVEMIENIANEHRLFFKRSILSKHGLAPVIADKYDERNNDIYTPSDFKTGETIEIGGRKFFFYDCDTFTRNYYSDELGIILNSFPDPYKVPQDEKKVEAEPRNMAATDHENIVLRFKANIYKASRNHINREFIVSVYPKDNSFSVFETPVRNSGFLGGKFSDRCRQPGIFKNDDFQIGSIIVASGTRFELIESDEFTRNYLLHH